MKIAKYMYCLIEEIVPNMMECNAHTNVFDTVQSVTESVHEISNNVVCATSKASDQPAHTRSLIRAFARRLSIL